MAKITNRFVHFKTKASFTSRLGAGDIQESSVVFIQDANEIWTHGTYYKCNISRAEVEALITSKGYITEEDIPSLTGGAAATSGQYVSGVTVSGHTVTVTKAALPAAPTLSGLGGIGTVSASGTAPLTLSTSKSGTSVTITGSVAVASSSSSGVVSTGTQTFAGKKTFSSEIQATGGISSKNIIHIDDGTYTGYLGNLDSIGLGSGDSFAVVSEGKLTLMTVDDSPIYFGQNEDCNITGSHFSGSAETANKVVGSLTIDGTAYNGSSNVTVNTKLLQGNNAGSIIKAGYSYSGCNSSITSISGFSYNNPDAVVASSTKITSFPSNVRKMANIANLSGTYYVYCFSYIGGYVYVNGAVYA